MATDYQYVNKASSFRRTRKATLRDDEEPDFDMLNFSERQALSMDDEKIRRRKDRQANLDAFLDCIGAETEDYDG